MSPRVEGKVAFITGAARGQGRAHAVRLAEEGANIIAVDICAPVRGVVYPAATADDLAETAKLVEGLGRRVLACQVDTRNLQALKDAADAGIEEFGRIDVVVANAGITIMGPWDKITPEVFADTIQVNLVGTWNTVMATAPHLALRKSGSIILISSVAGLKGLPFLVPYVASKHGITGLARAFAHELAQHSIRVNSVHPTGVYTPMNGCLDEAAQDAIANNPRIGSMYTNSLPVEMVEPSDISEMVLFLASDESRYVTASAMTVDAGNSQF
jgi:SDR family mycofactocin-dependent oxidoreductase